MSRTFYASAEAQLDEVLNAAREVDAAFIAKTAVYARERGYMKDMPALLVRAALDAAGGGVRCPRSAASSTTARCCATSCRSCGRARLGVSRWARGRSASSRRGWPGASDREIVRASVGQDPSLADVIKMVHPKPADASRAALYAYLIGKPYDVAALPQIGARVRGVQARRPARCRTCRSRC